VASSFLSLARGTRYCKPWCMSSSKCCCSPNSFRTLTRADKGTLARPLGSRDSGDSVASFGPFRVVSRACGFIGAKSSDDQHTEGSARQERGNRSARRRRGARRNSRSWRSANDRASRRVQRQARPGIHDSTSRGFVAIPANATVADLRKVLIDTKFSRIPFTKILWTTLQESPLPATCCKSPKAKRRREWCGNWRARHSLFRRPSTAPTC